MWLQCETDSMSSNSWSRCCNTALNRPHRILKRIPAPGLHLLLLLSSHFDNNSLSSSNPTGKGFETVTMHRFSISGRITQKWRGFSSISSPTMQRHMTQTRSCVARSWWRSIPSHMHNISSKSSLSSPYASSCWKVFSDLERYNYKGQVIDRNGFFLWWIRWMLCFVVCNLNL